MSTSTHSTTHRAVHGYTVCSYVERRPSVSFDLDVSGRTLLMRTGGLVGNTGLNYSSGRIRISRRSVEQCVRGAG
jgi:hypothetical protein